MGSFICRQPNGLLCRFSTVVDTVTDYNMTDEEYVEMKAEQAREEARDVLKNYMRPFEWVDDYFYPNNMTEEEFNHIKDEMCKPVEKQSKALPPLDDGGCVGIMTFATIKGQWKMVIDSETETMRSWHYECSNCGCQHSGGYDLDGFYNYCPNCGAKMEGKKDESSD